MKDDKKGASSIQRISNDADSAAATNWDWPVKERKCRRTIAIVIACVVIASVIIGCIVNRHIQERQFRDGLLETAISITEDYGIDDLTIQSVKCSSTYKVVFQSTEFAGLSNERKLYIFRELNEVTGTYSKVLSCWESGTVVIESDEKSYTAMIHEYAGNYQRYLYADGKAILENEYTKPSSSPSSSSSSRSSSESSPRTCSGGSVGCRSGFHPCHEMSNGYCNMCCKG